MTLDVHHHFIPSPFAEACRAGTLPEWSPEYSLDMMHERGVDKAWLSLPPPGVWHGNDAEARRLARSCNERAAAVAREHAPRFGFLASLPLPDVGGALEELQHALDNLGCDGVLLLSNVEGLYVGDRELDPVLAELDRRRARVLLHANEVPSGEENAAVFRRPEFPTDIARAYARLVLNDGFVRYPRIRWILADSGGPVPFLADRLARAHYTDGRKLRWARIAKDLVFRGSGGLKLARKVDYDSMSVGDPVVRAALDRLVPRERIHFASNFPFTEAQAR